MNTIQIQVAERHANTTVDLNNVVVTLEDGPTIPLGNFPGTANTWSFWTVSGIDQIGALGNGFTITAQIALTGAFAGGDELSKVEIDVGCS
jgi:hypothetical protein